MSKRTKEQRRRATVLAESQSLRRGRDDGYSISLVDAMEIVQESGVLKESWGEYLNPLDQIADDYGEQYRYSSISLVGDRRRGDNRPVFTTEQELAMIRGAARAMYGGYGTAICATQSLVTFVLRKKGIAVKVEEGVECQPGLRDAVARDVDCLFESNGWKLGKEEEEYIREIRDGEAITALIPRRDDSLRLAFIDPPQLTEPSAPERLEDWLRCERCGDWKYGIHTAGIDPLTLAPDNETVCGYYVQWTESPRDWHYFPACQVVHTKRNVDSGVKRGLSDFYAVQQHLTNIGKLERNVALGAAILSAIIGIRQHGAGVSRSDVQSKIAAARSRMTQTPSGRSVNVAKYLPGTWVDLPQGTEYKQSPLANQGIGDAFVTIEQALLRTVGSRWLMPEYLISGKIDAAYASLLVAESPFAGFCEREQGRREISRAELVWKALGILCRRGRYRRFGVWEIEDLRQRIRIICTGPIVSRAKIDETNRRKVLRDAGILSEESWSEEEGYDRKLELSRGAMRSDFTPGAPVTTPITPRPTDETGHPLMKESVEDVRRKRLHAASELLWEGYPSGSTTTTS